MRGRGLWAGVDIDPALGTGKQLSLRLAPARRAGQRHARINAARRSPLVITAAEIDWAVDRFADALAETAS